MNGWEALKALPFTCRATVLKYKIDDLLSTVPEALDGINSTIVNVKAADDDDKGYMHTMSDLVRFLLLYRYGGTYMDFDQLFLRKLPEDKLPLISREKYGMQVFATILRAPSVLKTLDVCKIIILCRDWI